MVSSRGKIAIAVSAVVVVLVVLRLLFGGVKAGSLEDDPNFNDTLRQGEEASKRHDYVTTLKFFKPEAEKGNPLAQLGIGMMYKDGRGVSKNFAEAARWLRLSADQGYANAQAEVADLYLAGGYGLTRDDAEGLRRMKLAAEAGSRAGQLWLAGLYQNGKLMPPNPSESFRWALKAAKQKDLDAARAVALFYLRGFGVAPDAAEGLRWFRDIADHGGDPIAENSIGVLYLTGPKGVTKDCKEAMQWFRKAADQGDVTAENNVGFLYAQGCGVPHDDGEALKWYARAAQGGSSMAQKNIAAIRDKQSALMLGVGIAALAGAAIIGNAIEQDQPSSSGSGGTYRYSYSLTPEPSKGGLSDDWFVPCAWGSPAYGTCH